MNQDRVLMQTPVGLLDPSIRRWPAILSLRIDLRNEVDRSKRRAYVFTIRL
jgi:hypothetical protein